MWIAANVGQNSDKSILGLKNDSLSFFFFYLSCKAPSILCLAKKPRSKESFFILHVGTYESRVIRHKSISFEFLFYQNQAGFGLRDFNEGFKIL